MPTKENCPQISTISPTQSTSSSEDFNTYRPITHTKNKRACTIKHHSPNVVSFSSLFPTYAAFTSTLSIVSIPTSYYEVLQDSAWERAMKEEWLLCIRIRFIVLHLWKIGFWFSHSLWSNVSS